MRGGALRLEFERPSRSWDLRLWSSTGYIPTLCDDVTFRSGYSRVEVQARARGRLSVWPALGGRTCARLNGHWGVYTNNRACRACTLKCTLDCRFRQAAVSGGAADAGPGAPRPGAARPLHLWASRADPRARVLRRIRSSTCSAVHPVRLHVPLSTQTSYIESSHPHRWSGESGDIDRDTP